MQEVDTVESEVGELSLGVLRNLAGYHLRRASGAFVSDFSRALEGTGMRQVLFAILSIIEANPGINQGSAGKVLGILRANMVALINELIERGLAERCVSKNDRRAFELSITPVGSAVLAECLDKIERHEAKMLCDFSPEERATLFELLLRIETRGT